MTSTWSKVGYGIGISWSLIFAFRYLAMWPDYSSAIVFISLGLGACALSWVYDTLLDRGNENQKRYDEIKATIDSIEEELHDVIQILKEKDIILGYEEPEVHSSPQKIIVEPNTETNERRS